MREDFWTLSILPHSGSNPKAYKLSRRHIDVSITLLALVILALIALTYAQIRNFSKSQDIAAVVNENESLRLRLAEMEERVSAHEEKMTKVSEAEMRFRRIAGLIGIEPEVREVGIGGPAAPTDGVESLAWSDETIGKRVQKTDEALATLSRRADLVYQSLMESLEKIEYDSKKFSCTPSIWPTSGRISSRYGARPHPIFGGIRPHEGVDIYAPKGAPIVATANGKVIRAGWEIGYGLSMVIDHGYGYRTFYAHCSKLKKSKGDRVKRGDVIAMVGNTGVTTGSHLHYEVTIDGKNVNPTNYILGMAVPD